MTRRTHLSSGAGVAVFVLSLVGYFFPDRLPPAATAIFLFLYAVLEWPSTARFHKIVIAVLVGIGVGLALMSADPIAVILNGFNRTSGFFVLFAAVLWLRIPADGSAALRAAQEAAIRQPPGRRYLILAVTSHVIGAVLNLAGLSLVSTIVARQNVEALQRRLTQSISQSFTAATCWTPFYTSMALVLTTVPGLTWGDIAPFGMILSGVLILASWGLSRLNRGGSVEIKSSTAVSHAPWRAFALLGILFAIVISLTEGAALPIPIALGLVAPVFGLAWTVGQHWKAARPVQAMSGLTRAVMEGIPNIRGEALLFLGANLMGAGLSANVSPEATKAALDSLHFSPDLNIVVVVLAMGLLGSIGVHGVILVVVVGQILPAEALGVPLPIYGLMLLAMWGISSAASPVSPTVLYVSRFCRTPPWTISWVWNGPYLAVGTAIIAIMAVTARHVAL